MVKVREAIGDCMLSISLPTVGNSISKIAYHGSVREAVLQVVLRVQSGAKPLPRCPRVIRSQWNRWRNQAIPQIRHLLRLRRHKRES